MSFNILINVTAFVFIHYVQINTFKLKCLIFVYELLPFLKFHRRRTFFLCVARHMRNCVPLHLDLVVCAVCVLRDTCETVYRFILI